MDKGKDALNVSTEPAHVGTYSSSQERSSSQIKSQIDRTRAEMDSTLDALSAQLNPRRLLDEFLDLFRGGDSGSEAKRMARKAGYKVFEKVKEHPIPAALAGAGLAYMLFFEKGEEENYESPVLSGDIYGTGQFAAGQTQADINMGAEDACGCVEPGMMSSYARGESHIEGPEVGAGPSTTEKVKERLSSAAGTVSEAAGGVKDKAAGAASTVKDKASSAANSAKDKAAGMIQSARQAMGSVKDSTAGAASKVKNAAASAAHGVGAAMHGVGAAAGKVGEFTGAVKDTVVSTAASVADRTSDLATHLGHRARVLGHDVSVGAVDAGHIVKAKAVGVGHQVQHGYQVSRRKAAELSDEYPLAVGAAILGLGMLVGLALPRTRKEDETIGEKADELKQKAKGAGRELINRGVEVVQTAAEEAVDEAKRQGLTPSAIAERARRAVSEVQDKVSEVAQREQLTPQALGEKVKAVAEHAKETAQQGLEQQQSNLQETNA